MDDKLETISKKLSIVIALMVKSLPETMDNKTAVALLSTYGLSNVEIASVLGMKPNAVSMARSRMNGGKDGKAKE